MSCWTTVPAVFSRGSLPLIKSSLIPFGAIILSQLLNGRDSIIPLLIAHNPIGSQTCKSPPRERHRLLVSARKIREKKKSATIWWMRSWLGMSVGKPGLCVGIPHTKGGLSNKHCWGQKQTVVKISASFRCLVLSYPLLSWPFSLHSLSVSAHRSQHKLKLAPKTQTNDYF